MPNLAIFKNSRFSKNLIIWHKTSELVKANCKIWYDLEDCFQCLLNFFSVSRHHGHTVYAVVSHLNNLSNIKI